MPQESDIRAWIERAQAGDVRAFEQLANAHFSQVRRFARAFAAHEADADDLAQEALVKAYKCLRSYRFQSAFSTWLFAVVRNVFIDAVRSRAGRERRSEEPLGEDHARAVSENPSAQALLEGEEERLRVWTALRTLPAEFRTALVLFDIEGHTYEEVAAIEEVAIGTVKSRLSRGRALLREALSPPRGTSGEAISSQPGRSKT